MPLKLMAVGDIHLGRRPSRLPEVLASRSWVLGPGGAWSRAVDEAIRQNVAVVALAGDVIEREDDFFEGYRELHAGVVRLAEAGIKVVGVAGNHDVRVLPRLATQLPEFHLLGRDGVWEPVEITAGEERLTIWGWSFSQEQVRSSPLTGVRFERRAGPNLGLLHCDRDQVGSPYAPVSSSELQSADLDGWLLAHIHAPDALSPNALVGYLGSLSGLDAGEPGAHGPWLVNVEQARIESVRQLVLAPLRWERMDLDLTDVAEAADARALLLHQLRELDTDLVGCSEPPEAVGVRVRLTGQSRLSSEVLALFGADEREHVFDGRSGAHYFVERLISATRPPIPLEELARRTDPPGLLARCLLLLDRSEDDTDRRTLIDGARRRLETRCRDQRWQALHADELDDQMAADWLRRAGMSLLEQMYAQREGVN